MPGSSFQLKIAFSDVDVVTARFSGKVYRIRVAAVRDESNRRAFAVVATDLDKHIAKRENLQLSERCEMQAQAWSVFTHGFSVLNYGVKSKVTKLVDHLLESGEAVEIG